MKIKIFVCFFLLFFILGCQLNNTPTAKVEELLSEYQELNSDLDYQYDNLFFVSDLSDKYIDDYERLIKKQYRNMTYEVKEEIIDGDNAEVTVLIDVKDYKSVLDYYMNDINSDDTIHDKIIKDLNGVKDKITYTVIFSVSKNYDGIWSVDPLSDEIVQKLLGIY